MLNPKKILMPITADIEKLENGRPRIVNYQNCGYFVAQAQAGQNIFQQVLIPQNSKPETVSRILEQMAGSQSALVELDSGEIVIAVNSNQ